MLSLDQLREDLIELFREPPLDEAEIRERWAQILSDYARGITPSADAAVGVGAEAMAVALVGIGAPLGFLQRFPPALSAFATTLAGGMTTTPPNPVHLASPPAEDIRLLPLTPTVDPEVAGTLLASRIHQWFLGGTAQLEESSSEQPWM